MSGNFSDYIVFVDESGDHSLKAIDPQYPVFVLSFCVFKKDVYCDNIVSKLRRLKFETFGHDMVILHEIDIRKRKGDFSCLSKEPRELFMSSLSELIQESDFTLFAVVINKRKLKSFYTEPKHPYHLAMEFGLERIYRFMKENRQDKGKTYLICEARGAKEDRLLELEFRRICAGDNYFQKPLPFDIVIADKKTNSEGLQFADLTARPIGLSVIKPKQVNRAYAVLEDKFYQDGYGNKKGFGLKIFP